jgi:hypothetical protein
MQEALASVEERSGGSSFLSHVLLALPPGEAIADIGAGQDVMGWEANQSLSKVLAEQGLRPVPLDTRPPRTKGVGGTAKVVGMALAPVTLFLEGAVIVGSG